MEAVRFSVLVIVRRIISNDGDFSSLRKHPSLIVMIPSYSLTSVCANLLSTSRIWRAVVFFVIRYRATLFYTYMNWENNGKENFSFRFFLFFR